MATPTMERRCVEVGVGKEDSGVVELEGVLDSAWDSALKNEVGRAIITTLRREIGGVYCAERGKGLRRKTAKAIEECGWHDGCGSLTHITGAEVEL
jgi:hypothetical protein